MLVFRLSINSLLHCNIFLVCAENRFSVEILENGLLQSSYFFFNFLLVSFFNNLCRTSKFWIKHSSKISFFSFFCNTMTVERKRSFRLDKIILNNKEPIQSKLRRSYNEHTDKRNKCENYPYYITTKRSVLYPCFITIL